MSIDGRLKIPLKKNLKNIPELTSLDNLQDKKILIWDEQGIGGYN